MSNIFLIFYLCSFYLPINFQHMIWTCNYNTVMTTQQWTELELYNQTAWLSQNPCYPQLWMQQPVILHAHYHGKNMAKLSLWWFSNIALSLWDHGDRVLEMKPHPPRRRPVYQTTLNPGITNSVHVHDDDDYMQILLNPFKIQLKIKTWIRISEKEIQAKRPSQPINTNIHEINWSH